MISVHKGHYSQHILLLAVRHNLDCPNTRESVESIEKVAVEMTRPAGERAKKVEEVTRQVEERAKEVVEVTRQAAGRAKEVAAKEPLVVVGPQQ